MKNKHFLIIAGIIICSLFISFKTAQSDAERGVGHALKGTWVVVDAIVQSEYFTRESVLGGTYTFTDTEVYYKKNLSSRDSSASQLKIIDHNTFETYNVDFDIRVSYEYAFKGSGSAQQLWMKSDNGFEYTLDRARR